LTQIALKAFKDKSQLWGAAAMESNCNLTFLFMAILSSIERNNLQLRLWKDPESAIYNFMPFNPKGVSKQSLLSV